MRRTKHQPMAHDEAQRLFALWMKKGEDEGAIVAATLVEDRLGFAIKAHFVELPTRGDVAKILTETALFDGYGPLASFVAKIDVASALGILTPERRRDFHVIRSIRNDFAHALEPLTFSNDDVLRKLNRLSTYGTLSEFKQEFKGSPGTATKRFFFRYCSYYGGYLTGHADAFMAARDIDRKMRSTASSAKSSSGEKR